jgi:multidrug resistance efflux pump
MPRIGSKRQWSCALAIILWASGVQISLYAQQASKLSPKVMEVMTRSPLEVKDDDAPLVRLKKERFNAALREAKARVDLYDRGFTRLPELIEVSERLFRAEVDLYDKPEDKAQVLQRHLDVYSEAEANLEKWVKESLATQADLERLRYDKLAVEIDLFNVKKAAQ